MASTTSTASGSAQTGPIVYKLTDQNTDTLYIATNSTGSQLNILTNSSANLLGVDLDWWAEANIPLTIDGNAHTFVLDSTTNSNYQAYGTTFQDGTLYYSAFANSGQNYIAVWLIPESSQTISQNGDGIYALSQIAVSDLQAAANSLQNGLSGLVGAVVAAAGGAMSGSSGGLSGMVVGALTSGVPALLTANATAQKQLTGVTPTTSSQVQTIAQNGYNAYYAAYEAAQQKLQTQSSSSKYNANASGSASSNGIDMNTTVVLGALLGLGVLGLIGIYMLTSNKEKK